MQAGYDGLLRDKTRPSRIPPLGSDIAERVVALTRTDPPVEATHWTASMMAKAVGISASSVQRIWHAHGLQPHRVQQFKLSNDPKFIDKLRDVVGLYVDPPAQAIVLSVDEKAQIQALDRTQPGLPMKKGRAGTMTHDYKRHGTTTLFAALDVLEGKVIGRCMQRHRHQEFIRFLNAIEAQVPDRKIVHVILDNYAAHKHPKVRQWLDRHPRFTFHFTPTSCSWLNAVEGLFAKLAKRRLKRGVFRCVVDLQATINRFVAETNLDPKPFTWTADPDKIIAAVRRGHQASAFHRTWPQRHKSSHRPGDALRSFGPTSPSSKRLPRSFRVASAMTTVFGSAIPCKRAARFGVSPTMPRSCASPDPIKSPTMTNPVAMPTRVCSGADAAWAALFIVFAAQNLIAPCCSRPEQLRPQLTCEMRRRKRTPKHVRAIVRARLYRKPCLSVRWRNEHRSD